MGTPEQDLGAMLDREAIEEAEEDACTAWVDYDVIPDLTKFLANFEYEKFDAAASYFRIHLAPDEGIVGWLRAEMADDCDIHWSFMHRSRGSTDFRELTQLYVNEFVIVENFLEYNREVVRGETV